MKPFARRLTFLATTISFLLGGAAIALAAAQTTCPVMGGPINRQIHADYQGQRVYFCCQACPPQFRQDPGKYLQKLKEMNQEPEQVPVDKKS